MSTQAAKPESAKPESVRQYIDVLDRRMAYLAAGSGDPIVLLHGNPTSSYLWRNIIPCLGESGRCIAPDLIGMGDSEKLDGSDPDRYDFETHRRFVDGLLDALDVSDHVTFIVHDWGSALGFDWACRHPDRVKAFVYMEAIVRPMSWDDWPEAIRPLFETMRSEAGESLILDKNIFVERILPGSIQRSLTDAEMEAYRAPFRNPGEDRRPTLSWPRAMPLGGQPADVVSIVDGYSQWMASNHIPKLFINADPGAILVGAQREFCRSWHNQTEITVPGIHFIQEDSADAIGAATQSFLHSLG